MCRERDDAGVVRRAHVQRGPAGAVRRQHGRTRSVRPRAERLRLGVALQRRAVAPAPARAVPATDTCALPLHRGTGHRRPLQSTVQRRTLRGHGLRVTSPRTCHVTPWADLQYTDKSYHEKRFNGYFHVYLGQPAILRGLASRKSLNIGLKGTIFLNDKYPASSSKAPKLGCLPVVFLA